MRSTLKVVDETISPLEVSRDGVHVTRAALFQPVPFCTLHCDLSPSLLKFEHASKLSDIHLQRGAGSTSSGRSIQTGSRGVSELFRKCRKEQRLVLMATQSCRAST